MIDSGKITADKAKMGYVGAFTYAEVISGYTFLLPGRSLRLPHRHHGSDLHRQLVR